jgi:hypothetical protein
MMDIIENLNILLWKSSIYLFHNEYCDLDIYKNNCDEIVEMLSNYQIKLIKTDSMLGKFVLNDIIEFYIPKTIIGSKLVNIIQNNIINKNEITNDYFKHDEFNDYIGNTVFTTDYDKQYNVIDDTLYISYQHSDIDVDLFETCLPNNLNYNDLSMSLLESTLLDDDLEYEPEEYSYSDDSEHWL